MPYHTGVFLRPTSDSRMCGFSSSSSSSCIPALNGNTKQAWAGVHDKSWNILKTVSHGKHLMYLWSGWAKWMTESTVQIQADAEASPYVISFTVHTSLDPMIARATLQYCEAFSHIFLIYIFFLISGLHWTRWNFDSQRLVNSSRHFKSLIRNVWETWNDMNWSPTATALR